jgi:hypothetical protein
MPLGQFSGISDICNRPQNAVLQIMDDTACPGIRHSCALKFAIDIGNRSMQIACRRSSIRTTASIFDTRMRDLLISPLSSLSALRQSFGSDCAGSSRWSVEEGPNRDAVEFPSIEYYPTAHAMHVIDHGGRFHRHSGGRK